METNASFDGQPIRLRLESNHLILIDPMAPDGLSQKLADLGRLPLPQQLPELQALGALGLRIGVQEVGGPVPGTYEIPLDAFEAADEGEDPRVFDIDTGTVIVIDGGALSAVALALTWERYDLLLQAPVDDDSMLKSINEEVGGLRFAIISADAESAFTGDGAFRLKPEGFVHIE